LKKIAAVILLSTSVFWAATAGAASANPVLVLLVQLVMAKIDTNGDNSVTRAELSMAEDHQFKMADKNGDGLVSHDEFEAAYVANVGQLGLPWAAQVFQTIDQDSDGFLSRDEIGAAAGNVFRLADRNRDGIVTSAELTSPDLLAP